MLTIILGRFVILVNVKIDFTVFLRIEFFGKKGAGGT